jgi:hypothetical protein
VRDGISGSGTSGKRTHEEGKKREEEEKTTDRIMEDKDALRGRLTMGTLSSI